MKTLQYVRTYSFFEPRYTYNVYDLVTNRKIGAVARNEDDPRRWWASNKTWTGGGDLARTFRTRHEAAVALRFIADGVDPAELGGYAHDVKNRLEYLRGEIRAERISYGEIAELQGLAEHIDPGDVELLQWAGVPEHAPYCGLCDGEHEPRDCPATQVMRDSEPD
jgi:hypothetical protein